MNCIETSTRLFQFIDYLKFLPDHCLQKIEDDLQIKFFTFFVIKNDLNVEETFHVLVNFILNLEDFWVRMSS